jgi:hypothetical protein
VDEGAGLEGVSGPFVAQEAAGEAAELGVDGADESLVGVLAAVAGLGRMAVRSPGCSVPMPIPPPGQVWLSGSDLILACLGVKRKYESDPARRPGPRLTRA